MKRFIKNWVQSCLVYKQAKSELEIPAGAWEVVTMEFVDGLTKFLGFNCIVVVVNKFYRYAHFVPLLDTYTALSVAMAYMKDTLSRNRLWFPPSVREQAVART
jgi:hypothetical protein